MRSMSSVAPITASAAEGSPFHGRIADSVVPQIDVLDETGWSGEEKKIHAEVRKILEMPDLDVAATTVRVPVHTGHSVALHIRTERDTTIEELEAALRGAAGLEYRPADGSERHPMPLDVEGRDPVLVGRLRAIPGRERGFALWVSSDNLRKGAALNAIQSAVCRRPGPLRTPPPASAVSEAPQTASPRRRSGCAFFLADAADDPSQPHPWAAHRILADLATLLPTAPADHDAWLGRAVRGDPPPRPRPARRRYCTTPAAGPRLVAPRAAVRETHAFVR